MKSLIVSSVLAATGLHADGHAYITAENTLTSEDESQLRQVIARLNHALDAADYPMYGSFFANDGVFVSGFGRTGTESMRRALDILGVGPRHHMIELGEGAPLRQRCLDLANGAEPDWGQLFEGYTACVDWPSAQHWRTLINVYPDAKVLLTMRFAESWWKSFEATLMRYMQSNDDPNGLASAIAKQVFDGRFADRDHAIALYNQNVSDVLATVPRERLLVHRLGDGWGPLCEWLDLPVPDVDYPSGNTTADLQSRFLDQGFDLR